MCLMPSAAAPSRSSTPSGPSRPVRLLTREHLPFAVGAVALVTLAAFENRATMTVLPTVATELDGLWLFGAAGAAPLVSFVVATVVAGAWADHRGPVPVLRAGLVVFVASQAAMALSPSMTFFTVGRFGSGVAEALMDVSLTVLLARALPEALRAKVFAAFAAAWVVPSLVGPPVAGVLTEAASWRVVFGIGVLLTLPAYLLLRPSLRVAVVAPQDVTAWTGRERSAVRAGTLAAVGLAALTAGGSLLGRAAPDPVVSAALVVAGLAVLGPATRAVLPAGTLRLARGIPALVALRGLVAAAFGTAGSLIPLMLTTVHGLGPAAAGASLTVTGLSWAAGSQLHGLDVVQRRVGPAARLRLGFALVAAGILGPALTSLEVLPVGAGLVLWGVAGLGMGVVSPTLSTQLLALSPVADQGRTTAASSLMASVAQGAAMAITGAAIAWQEPDLPGALFAVVMAASATVGLVGWAAARRGG